MTRRIKNLIAAVLIAISGYLGWTEILPAYPVITFMKAKIEEKNSLLVTRAEIINQIDKLRKESNAKYAELQRLALVVPEKKSIPEIITAVESIYSRSGFILSELGPGDSSGGGQVAKIGLKTSATGTYSQFLDFLGYFENNIRLFDVNKIDVGLPRISEGSEINNPKLGFTIEGQFYWLQPEVGTSSVGGRGSQSTSTEE